jgi:APA family basic amino acid/polyamine antiporter
MTTSDEPVPVQALPRRIGLWSAAMVVVGSTIGSGIFRSPKEIASNVPGTLPMLGVWVLGGLFALCGALSVSELASAYPATGGLYAFMREGWGRLGAFLFGWSQITILRAAGLGAIAITFAEYFLRLLGFDPSVAPYNQYAHYLAAVAVLVTAVFNIVGVRWGTAVNALTVVAKYGALCFIILAAFALGLPQTHGHYTPLVPACSLHLGGIGLALVAVLWVYDGWGDVSYVAGEISHPHRNIPRAIIGGTLAVCAIYLLANIGYLAVMPVDQIRTSKLVAADVAQQLLGRPGAVLMSATVMLSAFGTLSANLLTNPRILFAMADDGMLFKPAARIHPKYQTPYVSVLLIACLGVVYVLFLNFDQLADTFVVGILPFYGLVVAAIYRLRRRPGYAPPFSTPGYPWVPALFISSVIFLLANALVDSKTRVGTLAVFTLIAAGIPVYALTCGRPKSPRVEHTFKTRTLVSGEEE